MQRKVKVLLVDDHSVVRQGLRLVLGLHDGIDVCGDAETLNEAIQLVAKHKPDIVLLDYKLPDSDGVMGCSSIKKRHPNTKVIILTAYAEDQIILEAIKAGADGYLLKNIESDALIATILSVHNGEKVLGATATESFFGHIRAIHSSEIGSYQLSPREKHILQMVSTGKANKEIAETLGISDKTVRNYVSSILKKLNVSNRTEAAAYWIRNRSIV